MGQDALTQPFIVAVVVAHSRVESLESVLSAIRGQTRPPDSVLIVNSAATEEVQAVLDREQREHGVQILELGRNGGSAGSFGAGLEAAALPGWVDHVVAFDDDAVPAADALELLIAALADVSDVGAVGATSQTPAGELAWGLYVDEGDRPQHVRDHDELRAAARGRAAVSVSELAWHALLIPATVIRRLGGPWSDLFMWYEDVEYGLRLRTSGLRLYVVPAALVTHPVPPRTVRPPIFGRALQVPVMDRRRSYLMVRNSLVVRQRYCGARFWWVDLPLTLARAVVVTFSLPGSRRAALRDVLGRGVLDAARGRLGPPPFEE